MLGAKSQQPPLSPPALPSQGGGHTFSRWLFRSAHSPRGLPSCAGPAQASSRPGGGDCWRQVNGKAQLRSKRPGACREAGRSVCLRPHTTPAQTSASPFFAQSHSSVLPLARSPARTLAWLQMSDSSADIRSQYEPLCLEEVLAKLDDDRALVRLCNKQRMSLSCSPVQSGFRVFALLLFRTDTMPGIQLVEGSNSEPSFIGGSICGTPRVPAATLIHSPLLPVRLLTRFPSASLHPLTLPQQPNEQHW